MSPAATQAIGDPGNAISARGLTRRFGHVTAVDGIDLDIPRARIYGFLGPNGSGKSTTIRMLCGLMQPSAGTVSVLGHAMPRDAEELRTRLGYMTQKFSLWDDLTVRENLEFMAQVFGLAAPRRRERVAAAQRPRALLVERMQVELFGNDSPWGPRRFTNPNCCCSTSRPAPSTRRAAATSGRACSRWSPAA